MLDLVSLTYSISKQQLEYYSQHGGKIIEKANAKSNALDTLNYSGTRIYMGTLDQSVLLNSICLKGVSLKLLSKGHRFRDLNRARFMTSSTASVIRETKEEVVKKQRELVELAKLKGLYDKSVLDKQLLLARSKIFREYAALLISVKPGSNTPGIDKETIGNTDTESLVEYLRKEIYHPNKYKASPIRRV